MSYLKMLGLAEEPFQDNCESKFFFQEHFLEQYENLQQALQNPSSIALVVGEPGVGKTTLLRFTQEHAQNNWRLESLKISQAKTAEEILEQLLEQFHVIVDKNLPADLYCQQMLLALNARFNELAMFKLSPVILIDNAENLNLQALKILFDLSQLSPQGESAVRLALFGRSEILDNIRSEDLSEYQSRLNLIALNNFTIKQLPDYLGFRLVTAGYTQKLPFNEQQIENIFNKSMGNPALVNQLADEFLLKNTHDYSSQMESVNAAVKQEISSDYQSDFQNNTMNRDTREDMTYTKNGSGLEDDMDDLRFSSQKPINAFEEIQNISESDDEQQDLSTDDLARQLEQELADSHQFLQSGDASSPFLAPKVLIPGVAVLFILISSATYFLFSDDVPSSAVSEQQLSSQPLALPEENVSIEAQNSLQLKPSNTPSNVSPTDKSVVQTSAEEENLKALSQEAKIKKIPLIFLDDDLLEVVDTETSTQQESTQAINLAEKTPVFLDTGLNQNGAAENSPRQTDALLGNETKPLAVDFSHEKQKGSKVNNKVLEKVIHPAVNNVTPLPIIGSDKRQSIAINGKNFSQETQLILNWDLDKKKKEKVFSARLTPSQFKFENSQLIRLFVKTGTNPGTWQVQAVGAKNSHSTIHNFEVVQPFKQKTSKNGKKQDSKKAKAQVVKTQVVKEKANKNFILAQADNNYTIQLLSSSNPEAVKAIIKKHKLTDKSSWFRIERNGKPLYSLVYGSFKNKKSALQGHKRLPKSLAKNKAWIRKISDVKALIKSSKQVNPPPIQSKQTSLNQGQQKNANHLGISKHSQDEQLILSRDAQSWTFQLISLASANDMNDYIQRNKLGNKALYFKRTVNGKSRYTLLYGLYQSRQQAKNSMANLPKNIRAGKPWVRQYADIHTLMEK